MSFNQKLAGLVEPNDPAFDRAPESERKWYYTEVGKIALERLKKQLSRGIGANGRAMKPRIRAVLPDGSDGPVLEPHYDRSRVITMSDYMATGRGVTIFWHAGTGHREYRAATARRKAHIARHGTGPAKGRGKGRKHKAPPPAPKPFSQILEFHAAGRVPHAPVRDVRLSKASIRQIQLEARKKWQERQRSRTRREPKPRPQQQPQPTPAPKPRPAAARPFAWRQPVPHPTPTHPIPVHHAAPKGRTKGPIFVVTGRDKAKFPEQPRNR